MKRTHKINHGWAPPASPLHSDPVDDGYAAEVDASVKRAEKAHWRAQRNLERAEVKLAAAKMQAHAKRVSRKQLAELEALVELRRSDLEECQRMMVSVAASAQHRGRKSFRPVPSKSQASGL